MSWRNLTDSLSILGLQTSGTSSSTAQPAIDTVKQAELDLILNRDADEDAAGQQNDKVETWGLALSGGGIRSATFGLGVLQALARNDMLHCFHYQSTVSGGGYVGGFLQGLIRRQGFDHAFAVLGAPVPGLHSHAVDRAVDPVADVHKSASPGGSATASLPPELRHLREYSNYLSPRKSLLSGDTLGMVGTYVRNVVLIQLQLCAFLLALIQVPLLLHGGLEQLLQRWPNLPVLLSGWIALLAAVLLVYVTTSVNRPRDTSTAGDAEHEAPGQGVVLAAGAAVWTLALAASAGAIGIASFQTLPLWMDPLVQYTLGGVTAVLPHAAAAIEAWAAAPVARLAIAAGLFYCVVWMVWLILDVLYSRWVLVQSPPSGLQRHWKRHILATLGASLLVGGAIVLARPILAQADGAGTTWSVLIFGPCLVLLLFWAVGVVHVGLAGPAMSDLQREIWARIAGKSAAVVLGMTLVFALAVYGPWLLAYAQQLTQAGLGNIGWIGVFGWVAMTIAGLVAGHYEVPIDDAAGSTSTAGRLRRRLLLVLVRVAPWIFVLGLLVVLSAAAQVILQWLGWPVCTGCAPLRTGPDSSDALPPVSLAAYLDWLGDNVTQHFGTLPILTGSALGIWLLLGWAININTFSLNAFYRNRLVRCYLGASNAHRNPEPITNFDLDDDLVLADVVEQQRLDGCRPLYPLLGAALSLVAAKQLDWQDRKAASFCLSPGFCGYLPPDSRPDSQVVGDMRADTAATSRAGITGATGDSLATDLTLGGAMAISGAAVNPNMGYRSSPAMTFLLTLFDARLGWWLPNLRSEPSPAARGAPFFGGWLLAELFGRTDAAGRYVHVSDGGHFENLGIYELVRRRCRFIVCVDAGSDLEGRFADLGNAVLKCRVDFGAEIQMDVRALRVNGSGRAERSCAVGSIDYADGSRGVLLYLKPVLTGHEPTDVAYYASSHPQFPHEPTVDQFFDEAQFESYRRLGQDIMERALEPVLERIGAGVGSAAHDDFGIRDSERKEQFLAALSQQWIPSIPGFSARFSAHGATLMHLFEQMRQTPALAVLDAQLHSAWIDLVPVERQDGEDRVPTPTQRRTRMPDDQDFRACFYFCLELIGLMESVYHDLDLEQGWNHPDNRGWMNTVRNWSQVPMFRVAWTIGAPTFGSRFVAFCEQRLDMPPINDHGKDRHNVLHLVDASPALGVEWSVHCSALADAGLIDQVEASVLTSEPIWRGPGEAAPDRLLLFRLRWARVLPMVETGLPDTTLGIVAISSGKLRVLRIRRHLRQMGLGAELMRIVLLNEVIEGIDIRSGYYGLAGVYRNRAVRDFTAHLQQMIDRTRVHRKAEAQARADARHSRQPDRVGK